MAEQAERVSRVEQKRRTRAALVFAARGLFIGQGYSGTTADEIARAANVSRATFYLHFRSKAEIVLELMRAVEPQVLADFRRLAEVEPTREAAEKWLRSHAELWRQHRMEFSSMEQALADESAVADEWFGFYGRLADALPTVVERLSRDGLSRERARSRLVAMSMTIDRAFYFTVVREKEEAFEQLVAEIAEALARALKGSSEH